MELRSKVLYQWGASILGTLLEFWKFCGALVGQLVRVYVCGLLSPFFPVPFELASVLLI